MAGDRALVMKIVSLLALSSLLFACTAETAPDSAALKVPPGDASALAKALSRLIDDGAARQEMADAAWHAAATLPRWRETAAIVAELCRKVG